MPSQDKTEVTLVHVDATILSGANDSGEIDMINSVPVGLYIPATFDGTQLQFKAAKAIGGTYSLMYDGSGNIVTKTVAASVFIPLDPADFVGIRSLKLSAVTVQATTNTVITIAKRPV